MTHRTVPAARWLLPLAVAVSLLLSAAPAASLVTDFTANFSPDPAPGASTVTVNAACTYSDTETFVAATLTLGTTIPLSPVGPPTAVGGGLLRQELTGSFAAPDTPGGYTVGYRCQTSGADRIGVVGDLTVVAPTTTTTTTTTSTTTTTVNPVPPPPSAPPGTGRAAARKVGQIRFAG